MFYPVRENGIRSIRFGFGSEVSFSRIESIRRLYVCKMYYLRDGARPSFILADPENTFRSILLISF